MTIKYLKKAIKNPSTDDTKTRNTVQNILNDIEITTVKTVDEVLKVALVKELKPVEWIDVENLTKSKAGEKVTTGNPH